MLIPSFDRFPIPLFLYPFLVYPALFALFADRNRGVKRSLPAPESLPPRRW